MSIIKDIRGNIARIKTKGWTESNKVQLVTTMDSLNKKLSVLEENAQAIETKIRPELDKAKELLKEEQAKARGAKIGKTA